MCRTWELSLTQQMESNCKPISTKRIGRKEVQDKLWVRLDIAYLSFCLKQSQGK